MQHQHTHPHLEMYAEYRRANPPSRPPVHKIRWPEVVAVGVVALSLPFYLTLGVWVGLGLALLFETNFGRRRTR